MSECFNHTQLRNELGVSEKLMMLDWACLDGNGLSASGVKMVSVGEPFFVGHFPENPIMPGVLQVAAMAQLSMLLYRHTLPTFGGDSLALKSLRRIKFRKPVFPGMMLKVASEIVNRNENQEIEFKVSCSQEDGVQACCGYLTIGIQREQPDFCQEIGGDEKGHFAGEYSMLPFADVRTIMSVIAQRPPFLMLDGVYGMKEAAETGVIYGIKNVTGNDALLQGMPKAFLPDCLLIEAVAQLGSSQILACEENRGKLGIFMGIDKAHFFSRVFPGEQLIIKACNLPAGNGCISNAECWCKKRKIAEMELKAVIVNQI